MRILQVNSAVDLGGGETHVLHLVGELRHRGHTIAVAGRREGPLHPDIVLPFRNSADLRTALRLRSALRSGHFDIVHAHVARDYPVVAAAALGLPGLKVVFTRHLLYPVHKNVLYKRVDGWIAPTSRILRTLEPLKPKQGIVIPNWVDLQKFPFHPHTFHRPITLGLIGQIAPHKGHDDAIDALRLLGGDFRLLIAGRGHRSYEEKLKSSAAGLPVDFVGMVRLPDFFERIDIVILPSWDEPFGIVSLEAMATGIPVVATGPEEVVCGALIPPRDPRALADAVRSLKAEDYVAHARTHVENKFDMQKIVDQIEEFYASLEIRGQTTRSPNFRK